MADRESSFASRSTAENSMIAEAQAINLAGQKDSEEILGEYAKQDAALGEISQHLDRLKDMSAAMGEEVQRQTQEIAEIQRGSEDVEAKISGMAKGRMLGKIKTSKKGKTSKRVV